ncbi:MAG TPA: diadenylate cyclase [Roseiflexaceae bacterium]|nr:diadenylate cyclase [Roseiflexaceae bacterium]
MNEIEYFMWPYQQMFAISVQNTANDIFDLIDGRLKPKIFLLGFLAEDMENRHPICMEPEDSGYNPNLFADVMNRAVHFEAIDPEKDIIHSHPDAQLSHEKRLKSKSLKEAIQNLLRRYDEFYDLISFCSHSVFIDGYHVSVVIQFNKASFDSYYDLMRISFHDRYYVPNSLLRAIVSEFLDACTEALAKPNPGASLNVLKREPDEFIRSAGKSFTYAIAYKVGDIYGYGLWESCNAISSMRYEGAEGIGTMLIAKPDHPNIEIVLKFSSPISMKDHRAVRKLLEISSSENSLLTNAATIYGIGKINGLYDQRREDLFSVHFTKHYSWDLKHGDHIMMRVSYRQPSMPKPLIDKEKFIDTFKRIFQNSSPKNVEKIWALVIESTKQKHGTMVVVSKNAEEEAERLKKQAIRIEPTSLTIEMMGLITSIDGAVLISPFTVCYAIGVILDGMASDKGNPSRGARYNSAIRYIEGMPESLAIVVSVDGSVDLIPNLMPRIKKSLLLEQIKRFEAINESSNINVKEFDKVMTWFENYCFYLNKAMCDNINSIRREIEDRFPDYATRVTRKDFEPNEDMNETYFMEE